MPQAAGRKWHIPRMDTGRTMSFTELRRSSVLEKSSHLLLPERALDVLRQQSIPLWLLLPKGKRYSCLMRPSAEAGYIRGLDFRSLTEIRWRIAYGCLLEAGISPRCRLGKTISKTGMNMGSISPRACSSCVFRMKSMHVRNITAFHHFLTVFFSTMISWL